MLDDRDYMRQPEANVPRWSPRFGIQWSWTVVLLVAYAAVFVIGLIVEKFFPNNNFFHGHPILTKGGVEIFPGYLPLSVEGLRHGHVWQLVTYQFLHAGLMHILFNSWAIYMFGREVEAMLGGKKFLTLMFSLSPTLVCRLFFSCITRLKSLSSAKLGVLMSMWLLASSSCTLTKMLKLCSCGS